MNQEFYPQLGLMKKCRKAPVWPRAQCEAQCEEHTWQRLCRCHKGFWSFSQEQREAVRRIFRGRWSELIKTKMMIRFKVKGILCQGRHEGGQRERTWSELEADRAGIGGGDCT